MESDADRGRGQFSDRNCHDHRRVYGGLGLGSRVGGRIFGKRIASLVPYIFLEIGIGIYVLLSPFLFNLSSRLFTSLAESVGDRGILTVARLVVTLTALLLPALLMGATFPAMIAGSAPPDSPSRRTARTGYLYSVNTLGAAVGCFVGGFEFLFGFGVQTTLICAFGLYLLAGLCGLIANTIAQSKIVKDVRESRPGPEKDSGKRSRSPKQERAPQNQFPRH